MKINPAPLRLAQAVITGLVIALSIAILGTAAHTLHVFNKQQTTNSWWLPMWPQHFDIHGTKALVASSTVTFVLCGAFLAASFVPQLALRQKYHRRTLFGLAALLPSILLTLAAAAWSHILNNATPDIDTIQSWTCKYKSSQPLQQHVATPHGLGNSNFKSLCQESQFAYYGSWVVFLLLGIGTGLTVVTWLADMWAARQSRKEGLEMDGHP